MNSHRVVAGQPFSPRTIITTVNATICRMFFKAQKMWDELSMGTKARRSSSVRHPYVSRGANTLGQRTTVEMLPDDVLLEIFDHHRLVAQDYSSEPWEWHRLAHVCRRWRSVIFTSPCRLDLRLVYTYRKPVRKTLDCWPALPISIWYPRLVLYHPLPPTDEENVIAALKYPDRIREINLTITRPLLEKLTPLMQDPFPVLEYLQLGSRDMMELLALPSGFLGGSAPRLRHIDLDGAPFPALPRLLFSATDLVSLRIYEIPSTGYFSPESLVIGLGATPKLKSLEICFIHPTSSPDQGSPRPYPQTRAALPALTEFQFRGDNEYLEDLVARLDAPNIEQFNISLSDQRTFEFPQLAEFIDRTEELKSSPHRTSIWLWSRGFSITHYFGHPLPCGTFRLQISCHELARQVTLLTRVCRQLSLLVSSVERLDAEADHALWDESDSAQWLELFTPFSRVRRLELIGDLVPIVASALGQSKEVLPSLRDLHLRGATAFLSPPIESFVAARQLSGRPVSVHYAVEEMSP